MPKRRQSNFSTLILLVLLLLLAACAKNNNSTPELVSTSVQQTLMSSEVFFTPELTLSPSQAVPIPISPTPNPNRPRYQLDLTLNYYSQVADVKETIIYPNQSTKPLTEIVLAIPPRNYPDSYRQKELSGPLVNHFLEEGQFTTISLITPLEPGAQTEFQLEFRLALPEIEGTYGISHRQTNLYNWYPYIPPYDAEKGWIVHPMVVINSEQIGENVVNDSADFDVHLKLTDRANLIEVAASAPAIGTPKSGDYTYHLEQARSFAFSICDSYFEQEILHNGVLLRAYLFFNEVDQGQHMLQIAAQALDLYGELWMPYPREMLTIVAADFLHSMEMDGMVMISYGVIDNARIERESMLDYVLPHEISHQWFYSLVHNDQALEPWLDEALATYSESLFYERYYPDLLAWYWTNRADKYTLAGYVDSSVSENSGYDSYRNAVYLRGAQFLRDLRQTIGDKDFFASLKDYVETYSNQIASSQGFFEIFHAYSEKDFQPIIAQYFKRQP
jgi:hypothetical protein